MLEESKWIKVEEMFIRTRVGCLKPSPATRTIITSLTIKIIISGHYSLLLQIQRQQQLTVRTHRTPKPKDTTKAKFFLCVLAQGHFRHFILNSSHANKI